MLNDMFDLADKAARTVLGKRTELYTLEDWEDARQEALYGILKANLSTEGGSFLAAKHAICDWLRVWLRHRSIGSLREYEEIELYREDEVSTTFDVDTLRNMLLSTRINKTAESVLSAIEIDLKYLALTLAGRNMAGIGMELGLSYRAVRTARMRVRRSLEMLAQGVEARRKEYIVSEASLRNLRPRKARTNNGNNV